MVFSLLWLEKIVLKCVVSSFYSCLFKQGKKFFSVNKN